MITKRNIDAKLTLNDWITASQEEDEALRLEAEKRFLKAVEARIKELSGKAYEQHVLEKLGKKQALVPEAMDKRIAIVSPTTLLPVLHAVNQIWRIEKQNHNAQKIVKEAGKFFEKLNRFLESMEKIGSSLDDAKKHYDDAHKHLATGRGNLIRKAEGIKELGVRTRSTMPATFRQALESDASGADDADSAHE